MQTLKRGIGASDINATVFVDASRVLLVLFVSVRSVIVSLLKRTRGTSTHTTDTGGSVELHTSHVSILEVSSRGSVAHLRQPKRSTLVRMVERHSGSFSRTEKDDQRNPGETYLRPNRRSFPPPTNYLHRSRDNARCDFMGVFKS